jgi:hypothetical protein
MADFEVNDVVKSDVLELHVIRGGYREGSGRPLFLTPPRRFIGICKLIEAGASTAEACCRALVSYTGFRGHITKKPLYQKRLKKAEAGREQVWRSDALDAIHSAFAKNWPAAMTYLERRYPGEFALRNVSRPDTEQKAIQAEIPAEKLAHHRALMLELAREDEARAMAKTLPDTTHNNSVSQK